MLEYATFKGRGVVFLELTEEQYQEPKEKPPPRVQDSPQRLLCIRNDSCFLTNGSERRKSPSYLMSDNAYSV